MCLVLIPLILNADDPREGVLLHEIEGNPQVLYPFDSPIRMTAEVACTVQMAGDPYWAISDWVVGDEIFKTYQDPTVEGINCSYPFEIDAVAMELTFATAGTVWVSVDIEKLDTAMSLPACPYPGNVIGISDEWGFVIPGEGYYALIVTFNEPVTVTEPYFCGFYIASNVHDLGCEVVTDNDPYLCVNWNDWGDGFVDLVDNVYYNFPGNLILYSIGRSGGSSGLLPRTVFSWPPDSFEVNGNVYLRAGELLDTITFEYCRFEYFNPALGWNTITDDYTSAVSLRNSVFPASYQEGYSAVWNASSLGEGWYQLVSSVYDDLGNSASDTIDVYLDNTPLRPEFTNPGWGENICDSVTLMVTIPDEDVSFLQFEYRPAPDTLQIYPPLLLQNRYGDTDNDTLDGNTYTQGEYGDFYNAPTVLASIIRYFGNLGYTEIVMNGSNPLTDRQIVETLADSMKVRQNLGVEDDNFIWAAQNYYKTSGDNFAVRLITTLNAGLLDYIMGYRMGAVMVAIGEPYGIWLVINRFQVPYNQDSSYAIEYYDTKTAAKKAATIKFEPYPQIFYQGQYRTIDLCMGIYPKSDTVSKTAIGLDFNPADGYSFYWDASDLNQSGYYISATGVDQSSHVGEGVTHAYVSCQSYVSGDVNGDESVSVSDVVWLLNYIFASGPEPLPLLLNGDVNCDESVNVSDAAWLLNYIFSGGPPPCN